MRIQRNIAIVSAALSITMLFLSLLCFFLEVAFWENCCVGLFASSVLVLVTSWSTLLTERRNNIYKLYCSCMDFSQAAPFGRVMNNKESFLMVFDNINKATSIYNREISILAEELLGVYHNTPLLNNIKRIEVTTKILNNSLLDLNEKMMYCYLHDRSFSEFLKNEFEVNFSETMEAAKQFAEAVNELVEYIKKKKIHTWERCNNAD